ncbi:OmpA family protein [Leeia sp. TBRC 13508]|uniref:OmpA family protein n=1 Tax=Leeia speluncae TaxID=2884804 RepID=A0ABS8DAK3_9NEIS|nr:OmpA family protein [Leeia speluncae]MCB6185236.1 OmpA family protein [Leeia speluncae]
MNKTKLAFAVISAVVSFSAFAHDSDPYAGDAYLTDTRGKVVRNAYDECWRTGEWTPAKEIYGCGGAAPKKEVPVTPVAETPAAPSGPAKPAFEKVMLSAEALFDTNKSVVKSEGKASLDDLVSKLQQFPQVELILLTGHADYRGSDKANQKLSENRANAVKEYLVSKGIAADRIQAEGKGESEPVTKPGDCKGKKGASLSACLQPDRRVQVEIAVQREVK